MENITNMAENTVNEASLSVNLCEEGLSLSEEFLINYTDLGRQIMILDIGAPVSLAGVSWLTQYLKEFGVTVEEMKSTECNQVFKFGLSRRYTSQTMVEIPLVVTRLDGREDVLTVPTYLVDADVPFMCGK